MEGGRWKVGGGDDGRRQVGAHYFFFFNIIQFKTVSKRQDGLKVKMIWAGSLAPESPQRTTISASGFDPGDRHQKPPPRGNIEGVHMYLGRYVCMQFSFRSLVVGVDAADQRNA